MFTITKTQHHQQCVHVDSRLLTYFVFGIFQVEHEGPVFVLVLAVSLEAEVKHFLFNCNGQLCNFGLSYF